MASRPVVQQQNRGVEGVPGGIKQKNMAAEGRNRRALGDIGNMVTVRGAEGKQQQLPQVSRPLTRGFCAQLLANAQAAAADKNKKPIAVNVGGVAANQAAKVPRKQPAQKKVTVKPKPEAVIVISPDTEEEVEVKEKKSRRKAAAEDSSRKTYTATLTARSKIQDIDAGDLYNELAVVEYVEDIYKFYKEAENESRVRDYMDSQPEINVKMRAILVDWLIEVHHKFELTSETLYLTINIIDRYLAARTTSKRELQLVGISAMLIASKYEEIWAPEVNDFVCISDRAYTHQQVLEMEKRILGELEWYLTVPTLYVFLIRFIKAAAIPAAADPAMENMVYFLAELGMMNYPTMVMYCPSMIAASAVYVARCTLHKTPAWNETLKLHTGYSEAQLMDCAKLLVTCHFEAAAGQKLQVIYRKYSNPQKGGVAELPPAKFLLAPPAP
ncbi:PREDICTED: G2/mitotic-specific cyclin S13-7-like isoform X2 [Ipomoea nil]|uniref:G2/mitotic-specific cyclin S13-7-like isoform X2 n=1 Tax=Ipomoea nil TaxID=35883 RepID=UPI000901891D|nr:PREDICTED: G2/mitotic-specific cyclin S13-7-like isoform X2 [Ipomoea nil]